MLLLLCLFAFVAGLSNAAPVARIVDTHLPGGIRIVNDLVVIDEFHPFVKGVIDRAVEPYYQIIDHRFGKAKSLPITKAIEFFPVQLRKYFYATYPNIFFAKREPFIEPVVLEGLVREYVIARLERRVELAASEAQVGKILGDVGTGLGVASTVAGFAGPEALPVAYGASVLGGVASGVGQILQGNTAAGVADLALAPVPLGTFKTVASGINTVAQNLPTIISVVKNPQAAITSVENTATNALNTAKSVASTAVTAIKNEGSSLENEAKSVLSSIF